MSILRIQVHNELIVRAFTKGTILMHEILEGVPEGYILVNIEYGVPHSTFFLDVGEKSDGIKDIKVTYGPIKILE